MAQYSWNQIISGFENPHLLQTSQWAEVKRHSGWIAHYLAWISDGDGLDFIASKSGEFEVLKPAAAALVLERKVLPGLSVMYTPKGPLLEDWANRSYREQILLDLEVFAKKANAIQLKIDPDLELGRGVPGEEGSFEDPRGIDFLEELGQRGWLFSTDQIQFRNTVLVDLLEDEDH
ncbi:MAG: peptidoglycan bridge formation glycyltransferase FemA/FemB family protein, partial [Anaerolineales bacterium]|nr:peptidoglycan bridge formation glycyltransferase FemA/FemB family protein [Anaerolineales bacterium]